MIAGGEVSSLSTLISGIIREWKGDEHDIRSPIFSRVKGR